MNTEKVVSYFATFTVILFGKKDKMSREKKYYRGELQKLFFCPSYHSMIATTHFFWGMSLKEWYKACLNVKMIYQLVLLDVVL